MAEARDGGPAFPTLDSGAITQGADNGEQWLSFQSIGGMSLRDWFAGQALATFQHGSLPDLWTLAKREDRPIAAVMASLVYELADALLAERAKGSPDGH